MTPEFMEKGKISDLIFRELIKRGYSLEGNTRIWNIADSKLWYITPEQAQSFLDLEQSKDYQRDVIQKEIDLIKENIKEILSKIGNDAVNIIDLGCGDGKKAMLFLEYLKGKVKMRYCPIDISSYMVEKAIKRIKTLDLAKVVEFKWNISDFENLENVSFLLRDSEHKKNFLLLLGNTLGNFEINELLYQIRSSMRDHDTILIGNGLNTKKPADILKAYNNKFLDDFLIKMLEQIGFERKNLEYNTRFKNSRVEMYYTIKDDCKISFLGKSAYFNKGDQIIVAVSYKYEKNDFISFMKMYFNDVTTYVSKDNSYAIALCIK